MKLLVIADPMSRLKPLGDSTLALVRGALRRKDEVHWATDADISFVADHIEVVSAKVERCPPDALGELGAAKAGRLDAFDAVLIRKDPPFDESYVKLCWLLALEESRVLFVNKPSLLLRYHEKLVPLEARAQGYLRDEDLIPTHIGTAAGAAHFLKERDVDKAVSKPFLGFGGRDVAFWKRPAVPKEDGFVVQPFKEEVHARGDRRVIFVEGKLLAHFARMPPKGSFVSNLAQGGTAEALPLTPREAESCERLGKFLAHAGIFFAGADLIGHYVSEVNVTSPTGLRSLEALERKDYADAIVETIAARRPQGARPR